MESFDQENAFGILQQQHVHCHRKLHTQNACHNIQRGKTQRAFLQLGTTIHNVLAMLNAFHSLKDGHALCTSNASAEQVQYVELQEDHTFLGPLSP